MDEIDFRIVISLGEKTSQIRSWQAIQCSMCRKLVPGAVLTTLEIQEKPHDIILCQACLISLKIASKFYRFGQVQYYFEKNLAQEKFEPAEQAVEKPKAARN